MLSRQILVAVPGTCGELVQGMLDGTHFHLSSPIDRYAQVSVELLPEEGEWSSPPDTPKAARALHLALHALGVHASGGRMRIVSELPRGKGMASSTADVAGAIYAAGYLFGRPFPPGAVARLALSIEPTDGSLFPGIVLFDHREGRVMEPLGEAPALGVIVLDFGGEIDTLEYNQVDRSLLLRSLESRFREALEMVRAGIRFQQPEWIGHGATLSALTHQRLLPKPQLDAVLCLAREVGAYGVNIAHSGTVLGLLIAPDGVEAVLAYVRKKLSQLHRTIPCRLVSGGCRVLSVHEDETGETLSSRRGGGRRGSWR